MTSSKSILDQVDEYLHDNDQGSNDAPPKNNHLLSDAQYFQHEWLSDAIQVDLDNIGESLFSNKHHQISHGLLTNMEETTDKFGGDMLPELNNENVTHRSKNDYSVTHTNSLGYSPSASPMVAPSKHSIGLQVTPFMNAQLNVQPNSTLNTPFLGHSNKSTGITTNMAGSHYHESVSQFSPLSSPALASVEQNSFILPDSAVIPLASENGVISGRKSSTTSTKVKKRSSPNAPMKASNGPTSSSSSAKVIKSSPYLAANRSRRQISEHLKNSSSLESQPGNVNAPNTQAAPSSSSWDDLMFKLPESGLSNKKTNNENIIPNGNSPSTQSSSSHSSSTTKITNGSSSEPLPFPHVILPSNTNGSNSSIYSSVEPNENRNSRTKPSVILASESPVLTARRPSSTSYGNRSSKSISTRRLSRTSDTKMSKEGFKKESHKVAEQERRNRLNTALNDLNSLIPDELKATVSIPSKATTAELACIYIRQLVNELEGRTGIPNSKGTI